jgi:uncharacterized membrane protein YqgA involved in biofilm formation
MMAGTILNALGIVLGAIWGLFRSRQLSPSTQQAWRGIIGVLTVFVGLRVTVLSFTGSVPQNLRQLAVLVLALALGKLAGQALHLQRTFNRLGRIASHTYGKARPGQPNSFYDGFLVCSLVFCASPLGIVGAALAGLMKSWEPLAIKAAMDGLAAMGFACVFGWGVLLSALPVLVSQGIISLAAQRCMPFLANHHALDAVAGVAGLLVFCVALIVLELKKLEVADYLPSLVVAPLIASIWN